MKTAGRRGGPRSWFVEPYLQVKLGLMFIVVNILFSLAIFGIFGFFLWDIYAALSIIFKLDPEQSAQTAVKFATPALIGGGLIVVFMISTILIAARYTHKIYGPLVSIHRFLDTLLAGEQPTHLHLRESDQLQELAQKLNKLSDQISKS